MLALGLSAWASELYRWTDADGQVHFSDRPPAAGTYDEVRHLPAPRFADPGIPPGRYSVIEQWERLRDERLAREQERREYAKQARELSLREREVAASERAADNGAAPPTVVSPVWIGPRYPGRPHRPHPPPHHPPGQPKPDIGMWKRDHPAFRPPSYKHPRAPRGAGVTFRISE
jgi:hypothetical protein